MVDIPINPQHLTVWNSPGRPENSIEQKNLVERPEVPATPEFLHEISYYPLVD